MHAGNSIHSQQTFNSEQFDIAIYIIKITTIVGHCNLQYIIKIGTFIREKRKKDLHILIRLMKQQIRMGRKSSNNIFSCHCSFK